MIFAVLITLFLVGTAVGSFINVLESRLYKSENFLTLPSHCDFCRKKLRWCDMIPVYTWIWYGGKSRCCHRKLSWQYPIVELITGVAFVTIYLFGFTQINSRSTQIFSTWLIFIFYAVIFTLCFTIFLQDLKYQAIHERLLQLLITITLIFNFLQFIIKLPAGVYPALGGAGMTNVIYNLNLDIAFFSSLPFFILYKLSHEKWLGEGDVWLAAWMGLFLGFPQVFWAMYFGLIIGGTASLIIVLLKLKKMRDTISLGPFLLIGTLMSLFIQ